MPFSTKRHEIERDAHTHTRHQFRDRTERLDPSAVTQDPRSIMRTNTAHARRRRRCTVCCVPSATQPYGGLVPPPTGKLSSVLRTRRPLSSPMLRACQGFSVRVAHHLEKQQTRHGNLFLPSLPRRYTNKVVRWVSKPTGLFRGGQCPRQASQLVALPRDLPNRASGSISPLFGRLPPPKPSAARVAQAINTYRPGSKKRRATQRRHPSQMPGPPGKRWDATPTSTTPPQPQPCDPEAKTQHSARHGHTPPPLPHSSDGTL